MEGNVSVFDVRGMMHLLCESCDRGDTVDYLQDIINDVYQNFTSIIEALHDYLTRNFQGSYLPLGYSLMMEDMGMVITFCRRQLNWMVTEDGLMDVRSVSLLHMIEGQLLLLIEGVIHDLSWAEVDPTNIHALRYVYISTLAEEIEAVYWARNESSLMPSYLLIGNEGSVSDVSGMMHLLHQCCGRFVFADDSQEIIKDVYWNFTSIYEALNEYIWRNFQGSDLVFDYNGMMEEIGMVIAFWRWKLNWMIMEDGLMNGSSILLLEKIEDHFLLIIKDVIHDLSGAEVDPTNLFALRCVSISTMAEEIEAIYWARNETSVIPSYLLIRNEGSVTNVRRMMHLLSQSWDRGDTVDDLHEIIKDIYWNFTSIHNAVIALFDNLGTFHEDRQPCEYYSMREGMGMIITFCRWQLNWMGKDTVINISPALLLEKIELHLLLFVKCLTNYLSLQEFDSSKINDLSQNHILPLVKEIELIYPVAISRHEASLMPSYLLIGNEFYLEFLNQVHEDLQYFGSFEAEERKTMRGYLVLLRYYFEFTANRINDQEMHVFLISSQAVVFKMAIYSFFSKYAYLSTSSEDLFESVKHRLESEIHIGCLRIALVLPQRVSSSIPAMNNEVLTIYVSCIHDTLSGLKNHIAFVHLASPVTDPFMILPMDVSMSLLADSMPPPSTATEKLSTIRVWFRSLVTNVRYLSNVEMNGSISSELSESIRKVDLMTEEIIVGMYSIVLGTPEKESFRTHRLHFLIILLENLEDLIRSKSDLIMTTKDQFDAVDMNLALFRSFILNIEGNSTTHEGKDELIETLAYQIRSLRNFSLLDIDQINGQEMSELLICAQVTIFEMGCHHLFRRYGEVHWWKVYFQTKDHVVSHMCVGVLRAAVLSLEASGTQPLRYELLMVYVDCIQDNMTELLTDEPGGQMKSQIKKLHQYLSFPVLLLLIKYYANHEKESEIKLRFQALLRNIGSFICSCFNNRLTNLVTERVADLLELKILQEETLSFQYALILHIIRQESPQVHLPGFFDLLLRNWKDFIGRESDTVGNHGDQCQTIHEALLHFRSFIQNFTSNPTGDEESRRLLLTSMFNVSCNLDF